MRRSSAVLRQAVVLAAAALAPQFAFPEDDRLAAGPFIVGIGRSIHDPARATEAMAALGVRSVRIDAPWKSIETAPGRYVVPAWLDATVDAANARGIEPLLILAYGHPLYGNDKPRTTAAITAFTRYAVFVTEHFEGRVRYFDLWNEWDAQTGRTTPGTPEDYIALARRAYPTIKSATPTAIVLSGGISSLGPEHDWIERFVELGGLEHVDGLSLHPYNSQKRGAATPEAAIAELDRVHALAAAAGHGTTPIYVTEMGYPAFEGRGGVSPEVAAAYLARFMLLASTRSFVAGTWWYCLRDQGDDIHDKEHNFGVLDSSWRPKPAAHALRAVATLLAEVQRFRDDSLGSERRVAATRADGSSIALAWSDDEAAGQTLHQLRSMSGPDARAVSTRPRR